MIEGRNFMNNPKGEEQMNIDMNKKYETKNGFAVRILCTDFKGRSHQTIVGILTDEEGHESVEHWDTKGKYMLDLSESAMDLVEINPYDERQ